MIHSRTRFKLKFADNTLDSVDTGKHNFLVHFDHLRWPIMIATIMIIIIINFRNFDLLFGNLDFGAPYQFRQGDATVDAEEKERMFYNL